MDYLQTLLKDIWTKTSFLWSHSRKRLQMAPKDNYGEQFANWEYYCDDNGWFI